MFGDEFAYWAEDRFAEIDNFIRELNQWWADHGLSWLRYMSLAGIVMGESNFPVPPFALAIWRLLVGENPRANEYQLRDLAEYWAEEARKTGEVATEAAQAGAGVQVVWSGDGTPWVFQQHLSQVALSLMGLAETQAHLAAGVGQFTTQVVGAKAAFRAQVILLLFELVLAIATAVPTLGGSLLVAAGRRAAVFAAIKTAMRKFLAQITQVQFRNSLRELTRVPLRLGSTLPTRSLPRLAGPARVPITGGRFGFPQLSVPRVRVPRPTWRGLAELGRGVAKPLRAAPRAVANAGRSFGQHFSLSQFRPSWVAARRKAVLEQRQLVREQTRHILDLRRAGRPVPPSAIEGLARLRSPQMRDALTRNIDAGLRGRPLGSLPSTPARGTLTRTDELLARATARQVVNSGFTTWQGMRSALLGYGVRSALTFGAGGWVIQEGITHASLAHLGVKGYQSSFSSLAASVVGAGLGGAPLALSTRTFGMTILGGVGGGLGYYGSMLTEFAFNPNVSWADVKEQMGPLLLRAGGAENLQQAILQGAVGGPWERFIGEHGSIGDARRAASDFGLLRQSMGLGTPTIAPNGSIPTFATTNVNTLLGTNGIPTGAQPTPVGATNPAATPTSTTTSNTPSGPSNQPNTNTNTSSTSSDNTRRDQTPPPTQPQPPATTPPTNTPPPTPNPEPTPQPSTQTTPPANDNPTPQHSDNPERTIRLGPRVPPPPNTTEFELSLPSSTAESDGSSPPSSPAPEAPPSRGPLEEAVDPSPRGLSEEAVGSSPEAESRATREPSSSPESDSSSTPAPESASTPSPESTSPSDSTAPPGSTSPSSPTSSPETTSQTTEPSPDPTPEQADRPGDHDSAGDHETGQAAQQAPTGDSAGSSRPADSDAEVASSPVVGDVYAGQPRLLQAPSPPEQISVPGDDVLNWADNVRDAVGAVTREALAHPGDPAYWKPGPAGWLVQGSHDGQPLVVMVDADGVVTDAWHGGFSQSTQTSVPEAVSALHTALDEAKVVDADNGVVALRLPSGSTIEVRLAVDPDLAEGATFVAPPRYELTPAGWRQSDPATVVVSATVRTDQLEIAQDIGSHLAFALTRLDATLPGPLVDAPVRPDAGRATPPRGLRVGDLWQASPTTVHTDTADVDQSDPHASDRLAAALSHLQTTTTPGRPVVAVTGDPNMGVKLARFPDGDSVAFIVETTADLPAGAVEVTPANWVFDGETMRQAGQPARLRLSDQLPTSTPEAADDQIARMLNTGLEGLRDTLPNLDRPSRIHNLLDMQDLATALHPRDSESSQDEPPVVLPDPLDTSTTPESGARGSFLVTVPPAAQFALGVRSALDGLERAGYQVVDIVDGWSRSEGPGMVVRVHPPGADTVDGPIQLRLLPGEGLDAYRQIVEAADRQKLPPEQVRQQLAQHPDLAAPEQVSGEPADTRPPVASAGAEQGLDPTPTTIAHGTVRMEDHPDFPALRQKLEDLGFPLVPVGKPTAPPHVEIRKVYDEDGNLLRTEREVQVHEGMRFLDLEHEADHVYQMTQRFPEGPPPTSVWQQRADGTLKELPHVAERMTTWQDAIIEYHVRLQEYIRLAERGVDSDVLREHLAGVDERRDIYWKKGVKKGRSLSQTAWAERHFPDIPTLEARVQELRAGPLMASADAYRGLDPTPTTIAHGTVRMEEHPDFPALRQELEDLGFRLVPVSNPSDAPHVEVRRILDEDGNLLRTEREVQVREGMRFLDLEHERDHVYQMVQRFDEPVPTTVWEQKANGRLKEISNSPARMKDWQDAIIEYHVRLQEYIRLAERGVDADTLREHLDGLDLHHNRYWFKGINRKYNINHQKWADKHFPDIPDLQRRAYELRTTPSRPDDSTPAGRHASSGDDDAGPLMAKAPNPSGTPPPPPPARRVTVAVPDKYPVSAHPTEVQQTVTDRLAGLPQTGHIPGLEAVRQLNNGRWELTYHGHPTEVEVVVRTDLPAGQARVTPARIELSANTPNGRRGDLVTGPLLTEAIHAHSGIVGSSTSAAGTSTSSTASQAQSQAPATPGGGSRPGGGPAQTAQGVHTPTGESTAAPGPVRVNVSMYGQATSLRVDAVRDVVQRLLPRLSSREVPRLEAVRPTPDPSVWTVTYGGIEAQVRITVSAELPAGRATLEPGSITLSGHAPDRMGDAITQAAVRQVLAEYGEHVRAGAVGSLAAQAVRAAGLSAADRLATEHPDLVSDGYRLRTATDPKHGELLIAEGPELPAAAFQFASRSLGDVVATTSPTGLVTPEGLPIYQITISEQIPEADRAATVPRVVAREVAEQLYQLRHSRRLHRWLDRLADAQQLAAQQSGDLAELRLELEHRAAATDPTTHDRRVGELLDRLAAEKRLDQAISQLEAAGQHADVALIRELLDPSARWRAEVAAERRAEVRAAVTEAAARLAEPSVAMITDAAVRGDLVRVTVADGSTVDVPIAASITALAGADVVGARLHARAAAELAFAVAEAAGDRLGHGWSSTPAVGTVEALIRLHDALPAGSRTEYVDELSARLKLLAADQIARVLPNLPTEPKKEAGQRIAEHVLWETVTALSGDGPTALARTVSRRSDDGWTLAGRFRERHVPAETVNKMTVWLGKRLESGASVHRARAEAAGVLGAELGAVSRARQPRLVGALRALAELWQDAALPVGTRMAVEALTGEVLSEHTLRPADWRALPPAAQDLVRQAPDAGLPDPFAPLRPHSQQELVQRIADEVKVVADQLKVGEFASASADAAEKAARMVARVLGEAEVGLRERSQARERYANEARARAEEHERGAQAEAQLPVKDRWADERKQALEHDAAVERANAERHARIGARYDQAREAAENAQRVYEELRAGLADLTSASESERDAALRRVKELAGGALNAFNYYLKTVRSTQPVLLETGVPPERLPYLNALSAKVNALVAAQGVDTTVQPDELQRILRSGWGFVTSDEGLVFPLNFGDVEVRVAFKPGDAVEVLDPPQRAAEVIQAQLPQFPKGNRVLGATTKQHIKASHEHSLVGNILNWAGEAIPEDTSIPMVDVARETLRRAVLKLGFDHGRTTSFSGEGFGRFTVPGQVADNRGDSTYYSADGHFDVQIRRAGAHSRWTPVERVDAAIGDDSNFLKLAVEHVYTEPAPQATERLQSPPSDRTFPAHSLVRLSGLEDIRETVLDLLGRERDDAWQQVYTMVREEFPARLDHAIDHPHGFMRPIYSQGRPLALVQIKTEVVLSSAERIGTASNKVHLEQLRVSFAGYGGGVEWSRAHSKSGTAGVTMLPKKDNPLGELPDGSFTGQYSRDSSRREGIGVGGTAIRPNVQRYTGRTQAYRLELVHTVSVQRLDQPGSSPVSRSLSPSEAIVRLPELDAYRYGLPVDEAAVKRDSKGNKLYHPDGTAMLLDDLQDGPPPGRLKHPPRYLVGDEAIPGAGPALVQNLTGIEDLQKDLAAVLRERGYLPEQDRDGWVELPRSPMLASAQLANVLEFAELNGARVEGGYDQAAQDGLQLVFTKHRVGMAPKHLTLRLRITPDWKKADLIGHRFADTDVALDIISQRFVRKTGESSGQGFGPNADVSGGADGFGGVGPVEAGGAGFGGRGRSTHSSGTEYGDTVNHVKLIEGLANAYTATFRVPHTVKVVEVLADGSESKQPLVEGTGTADVRISADLLQPDQKSQDESVRTTGPTSERVLRRATLLHLNAKGIWERVRQVLPQGARPGAPSYDHLVGFVDSRSLLASPWWLYRDHGTEFAVDPRGEVQKRSSLWVRGKPRASEFLQAARLVVGDVNLTMSADTVTFSHSGAATGSASGKGGYEAPDTAGASAKTDGSRETSRTSTRIYGRERIAIENSVHYLYKMSVDIDVKGVEHRSAAAGGDRPSNRLLPSSVVYSVPERTALELYVDGELPVPQGQIMDVLRRYAEGKLDLNRRTVVRILAKLHSEHVATGKSKFLPGSILYAHGRLASKMVDRLIQAFPDVRVSPSGVIRRLQLLVDRGLTQPEAPASVAKVLRVAEPLKNALGQGGIEPGAVFTKPGAQTPVDLSDEVMRLIDQVVPEATTRTPGLRQGLIGQFAGEGWTGKLDRMLAEGFDMDFPVQNRLGTETVRLQINATLSNGEFIGDSPTTGSVAQDYAFAEHRVGRGYGRSSGGDLSGVGVPGGTPQIAGDVGHGGSSWASAQNTRIQRISTFAGGMQRVARDLTLTIKVSLPNQEDPKTTSVNLSSRVVHLVPPNMLVPDPGATNQPQSSAQSSVRPIGALPHRYFVERVDAGDLYSVVREALAQPHLLGERGMSQNEVSLQRQLSAMPVNAGLDRMSGPGGHPSVTLRENGRPDRMIQVFIKAEPVDQPRPIVSGRPDVGIGQDDRGQHVMGQDTSRDRWRPAALGGGAADPFFDTGVSGNLTFRDSSSHNYTVRRGDRDERKIYEEGTADTLAQSIRYSVTVVEKKVLPGGRERVVRREPVAETALGTAYLTMFDTDHAAMRGAGDEAGGLRPWLGEPVAPTGARRGWRLPLPSHPRILMLSLDAAAEAAAQRSGPDAADLRVAITDEVRRRLRDKQWRSAAMLQLNVNASVVSGVDLDALAQEIAKARGGGVIIDVTAPDQTVRHYGRPPAHPD